MFGTLALAATATIPATDEDRARWVFSAALGYGFAVTRVAFHGTRFPLNSQGVVVAVGAHRELRGSAYAARAGLTLDQWWGTSYGSYRYGFDAAVPTSIVVFVAPALAAAIRWVPGRFFIGLAGRVGIVHMSGRAGTGTSEAAFAGTHPYGMLRFEIGARVGAERSWELGLSTGVALAPGGAAEAVDAVVGVSHAL